MSKDIFNKNENLSYLSILILVVLNKLYSDEFIYFLFLWIILIVILGNLRRLSRRNKTSYFIRMVMYFLPYSILPIFLGKIYIYQDVYKLFVGIVLSFICSSFIYLYEFKKYKLYLSDYNIALCIKKTKYQYILMCINLIGSAICEELFFRNFILTINSNQILLLLISIFYFFLSHFILKWSAAFNRYDFLKQLIIGFLSGCLFLFSKSIIPSIILHGLMNSPNVVYEIKCYKRHYKYKAFYDNINNIDEAINIDLF